MTHTEQLVDPGEAAILVENVHVRDITEGVAEAVRESGIHSGICCVYSRRTTSVVRVSENARGLLADFASLLARLVPRPARAVERGRDGRIGHARCAAMLLGAAGKPIPVADGELCRGRRQRVLLLELDGDRGHERGDWIVRVVGSAPPVRGPADYAEARPKSAFEGRRRSEAVG